MHFLSTFFLVSARIRLSFHDGRAPTTTLLALWSALIYCSLCSKYAVAHIPLFNGTVIDDANPYIAIYLFFETSTLSSRSWVQVSERNLKSLCTLSVSHCLLSTDVSKMMSSTGYATNAVHLSDVAYLSKSNWTKPKNDSALPSMFLIYMSPLLRDPVIFSFIDS